MTILNHFCLTQHPQIHKCLWLDESANLEESTNKNQKGLFAELQWIWGIFLLMRLLSPTDNRHTQIKYNKIKLNKIKHNYCNAVQ